MPTPRPRPTTQPAKRSPSRRSTTAWPPSWPARRRPRRRSSPRAEPGPDLVTRPGFEEDVVRVLEGLRPGDLVTYGDVAEEAGHPGAARAVGRLL
ncbi:hypothetical protein B7486_78005, partial [cyanobacterium TDX16]